jgi:hypothetical protein
VGNNVAHGKYGHPNSDLISGVPVKAHICFKGKAAEESQLSLLEFPVKTNSGERKEFNVRFKALNVPYYSGGKGFTNSNLHFEIADQVYMKITGAEKSGNKITINHVVTNKDADKDIALRVNGTRMFDANGNEYQCSTGSFGSNSGGKYANLSNKLIRDVPVKGSISFEDSRLADVHNIVMLQIKVGKNFFKIKNLDVK